MSDEFDEIIEPCFRQPGPGLGDRPVARALPSVPRLVARLYERANLPLRARLIACLLQPLGSLGLAGVAAGAFAVFLSRRGYPDAGVDLVRTARVSSEQIHELARFVEEVNPEALLRFAELIAGNHLGLASFSASALVLLYRTLPEPTSSMLPADAVPVDTASDDAFGLAPGAP